MHKSHLPPITPALVLETTGLEVFRDQAGMRACNERGIGARLRKLGPPSLTPNVGALDGLERARCGARSLLIAMCKTCPHDRCKMKTWHKV